MPSNTRSAAPAQEARNGRLITTLLSNLSQSHRASPSRAPRSRYRMHTRRAAFIMTSAAMPKGEREDLQRLVRQREKVLKSAAKQRSAELLADFENQMGQEYSFDQDEIWEQAVKNVQPLVERAQKQIAARCRELGIPERFAPSVDLSWHARGFGNCLEKRRTELRKMATTRIGAIERKAVTDIELSCLQAQEQIALAGLSSDAARHFIETLPGIETLMPALSFTEIAGEADPPAAEQLISSNAQRQRRYRERQAALRDRNGDAQALRPPSNADDDDECVS